MSPYTESWKRSYGYESEKESRKKVREL